MYVSSLACFEVFKYAISMTSISTLLIFAANKKTSPFTPKDPNKRENIIGLCLSCAEIALHIALDVEYMKFDYAEPWVY